MAQEFNDTWAQGIIEGNAAEAESVLGDSLQVDALLAQLQTKLADVPNIAAGALQNVPLMASMVKSYVTQEYTNVSPKVVASLVAGFLYLVKQKDIIPDSIPIIGLADDLAVVTFIMALNGPELEEFSAWRDEHPQIEDAIVVEE